MVFLLPIRSEKMPVGISKTAELTLTKEKISIPKANDPVTLLKYKIAITAYGRNSEKKLNQVKK